MVSGGPCVWATTTAPYCRQHKQHVLGQTTLKLHIETNETHASCTAHGFISQDVFITDLVDTRTYYSTVTGMASVIGAGSVSLFNMADAGDAGD